MTITVTSSLLQVTLPLCFASILSSLRVHRYGFFSWHQSTGSHVPSQRLNQSHAVSTPDAVQAAFQVTLELFPKH